MTERVEGKKQRREEEGMNGVERLPHGVACGPPPFREVPEHIVADRIIESEDEVAPGDSGDRGNKGRRDRDGDNRGEKFPGAPMSGQPPVVGEDEEHREKRQRDIGVDPQRFGNHRGGGDPASDDRWMAAFRRSARVMRKPAVTAASAD
jgi:hypothetical protein